MTTGSSEEALPASRFGTRRLLKTVAIVAGCAAIVAFVLLPIGRPAPPSPAEAALLGLAPAKPGCKERPREIVIDGRRVDAFEIVCGDDASTLAALPALEEQTTTWSMPASDEAMIEPATEEARASVAAPSERPTAVAPRAKPKPRPAAQRPPPPRSVAAATSVSQEKYGP